MCIYKIDYVHEASFSVAAWCACASVFKIKRGVRPADNYVGIVVGVYLVRDNCLVNSTHSLRILIQTFSA